MRKHAQKKRTSVPPDPFELLPEAKRTDQNFGKEVCDWLAQRARAADVYGPEFIKWFKKVTEENRETLEHLFCQYGIRPSLVLNILEAQKTNLLSREQFKSNLWRKNWPRIAMMAARLGLPDTPMAKIRRNKKRREEKARILEKAAAVLNEYPGYFTTLPNVNDLDEIVFDLPKHIRAIAADMRRNSRSAKHRPQEGAAGMVLENLTDTFRLAVKRPLWEYAASLTKSCFPTEWNPARDPREAAKKLVKARKKRFLHE